LKKKVKRAGKNMKTKAQEIRESKKNPRKSFHPFSFYRFVEVLKQGF